METQTNVLIERLIAVEGEMNDVLVERQEPIRALLLCLMTNQHMLMLGPAGVGKSMVMDTLAAHFQGEESMRSFDIMMMKTTSISELFGPDSLQGHLSGDPCRIIEGFAADSHLLFIDELDKSGSYQLNSFLKLMNERRFRNGKTVLQAPLISFIGAANAMPPGEEMAPFLDRIVSKVTVDDLTDAGMHTMLQRGIARRAGRTLGAPITTMTLDELREIQRMVLQVPVPNSVLLLYEGLRRDLAADGIVASPRRWDWCVTLMQAAALLDGRDSVEADDISVLADALWNSPEQRVGIKSRTNRLANPTVAKAVELGFTASDVFARAMQSYNEAVASGDDGQKEEAEVGLQKANSRLKSITAEVKKLYEGCVQAGRNPSRIKAVLDTVDANREQVMNVVMGMY